MQQTVTLTDQEVTEAIIEYVSKHGVKFEGMQAEVSVIAGRRENGTYATIDLKPKSTQINVNPSVNKELEGISKKSEPAPSLNEFTEISPKYEKTSNESLSQEFSEDEPDEEEELFS